MFGNKKAKRDRLDKLVDALGDREMGATELAKALGVSRHAILDDVNALDRRGVKLCERNGKFSLMSKWFGKGDKKSPK
jgi:biotin operon repressor